MLGVGLGLVQAALHPRRDAVSRDVVILAYGQSNEQASNLNGGAPIDPVLDQDGTGRIRVWRASDGTDIAAIQPLASGLWISGSQNGPLRTFRLAQELLATRTGKIVIVPCAVGGAVLTNGTLGVGGAVFATTQARLGTCLAAFPGAEVILSWTQGEQDANQNVTEAAYRTAFAAMVSELRAVPGAANMTVILHQMVPERLFGAANLPARVEIDDAHKRIPLSVPRSVFVAASLGMQIPSDPSHFNSEGHRTAGTRAAGAIGQAAVWATTVPEAPSAPVVQTGRIVRVTVPNPVPPAFVVEHRAVGNTGPWADQVVFPEIWVEPGDTFDVAVEGAGDTDVRLRARSFAGQSAPSDSVTITVPVVSWVHPKATVHLDYTNDRAFINGTTYGSIAAARTAGAIVRTGGIDRVGVSPAASWALVASGVTGSTAPGNNSPRYLAALDNGPVGSSIDHLALLSDVVFNNGPYSYNVAMFTNSTSQLADVPQPATTRPAVVSTPIRMGLRAKRDATIASMNGATIGLDTACILPMVTQLVVGNRHDGNRAWTGAVDQVLFVNSEITEAELNTAL